MSNDNNTPCEICKKIKPDVRFEGSFEGFVCDECLEELKRNDFLEDSRTEDEKEVLENE